MKGREKEMKEEIFGFKQKVAIDLGLGLEDLLLLNALIFIYFRYVEVFNADLYAQISYAEILHELPILGKVKDRIDKLNQLGIIHKMTTADKKVYVRLTIPMELFAEVPNECE